jgi:hypothetical protein
VALVPREGFEPPTYCLEGTPAGAEAADELGSSDFTQRNRC